VPVVGSDKERLALSDGLASPFTQPVNNRATRSYLVCGDSPLWSTHRHDAPRSLLLAATL
jgi:hypothetical protein